MDDDEIRVATRATPRSGARPGRLRRGRAVTGAIAVVLAVGVLEACGESPDGRAPADASAPTRTAGPRPVPLEPGPVPSPRAPGEPAPPVGTVPMPTVDPPGEPVPMPTVAPIVPPVPMPPDLDRENPREPD
jgi:hypothetical protein